MPLSGVTAVFLFFEKNPVCALYTRFPSTNLSATSILLIPIVGLVGNGALNQPLLQGRI